MSTQDEPSLVEMCHAFPLRTGLFTLGPLAVGLAQVWNVALHGGSVLPVVAVAAATCLFSVLVTNYHLAAYRRRTLLGDLD